MRRSGRAWAMDLVGSLSFREWCGSRGPVNLREDLSVFSSLFLPLSAVAYPVGPQRRMAEKPDIDHSAQLRSEEHTSELQSRMRISYAVFCLQKINKYHTHTHRLYYETVTHDPKHTMSNTEQHINT